MATLLADITKDNNSPNERDPEKYIGSMNDSSKHSETYDV
jgi:hypothetical protein